MSMHFKSSQDHAGQIADRVAKNTESMILQQLGELTKAGLVVIESTQPVIVQTYDIFADEQKFEVRQMVRLKLRDQEVIDDLRAKLTASETELNGMKALIKSALEHKNPDPKKGEA